MIDTRVAPQNLDAERSVLGGLLADPTIIGAVAEVLVPEDFYLESHQKLFTFIIAEYRAGRIPTVIEVADFIKSQSLGIDIAHVLGMIEGAPPSSVVTVQHARLVKEDFRRRDLLTKLREAEDAIYRREKPSDVAGTLASFVGKMAAQGDGGGFENAAVVSIRAEKQIQEAFECYRDRRVPPNAVPTGFSEIDRKIGGLFRKDLSVVAARPSMGKSAFGSCVAENVARRGIGVAIVTCESSSEAIAKRMISRGSGVENRRLRQGSLADSDFPKVTNAIGRLHGLPIFFHDAGRRWLTIRSRVENLKLYEPSLGLLVIDYAQLLQAEGKSDARYLDVGVISAEAKDLAASLNIAVLMLAQVNRKVEERQDKRPMASDLRESGNIEQDADMIATLFRPYFYDKTADPREAFFTVRKVREGVTGDIGMRFNAETVSFADLEYPLEEAGEDED